MKETFVGDVVKIILDTQADLTIFNFLHIVYRKPSGIFGHWTAVIGEEDYLMEHTTNNTDLDEAGEWTVQARVGNILGTYLLSGKWVNFKVKTPIPGYQIGPS